MLKHVFASFKSLSQLTYSERDALTKLFVGEEFFNPNQSVSRRRTYRDCLSMVVDGVACRAKITRDGERQIVGLRFAGEFVDLQNLFCANDDGAVTALTKCHMAFVSMPHLRSAVERHPRIAKALWQEVFVEAAIAREWILNLGRRDALSRVAHFLCELHVRMLRAGFPPSRAPDTICSQAEIADATGLTAVHVNRMIQRLRAAGALPLKQADMTPAHFDLLSIHAVFDPKYLYPNEDQRYE